MQFGFDKFFEMFESRFGRRPTTILLLLCGLGLAALMVNLIVQYAVKPIADAVDRLTQGNGIDWRAVVVNALVWVGVAAASAVLYWTFTMWLNRRWKREADRITEECRRELKKAEETLQQSIWMDAETKKRMDDIEARTQKAMADVERPLYAGPPEVQPPQ